MAPVAVAGAISLKMAADFEKSMLLVHTQAGYAESSIKGFSDAILKMAPSVGFAPKALADALFHIASAGVPAADAMNVLKAAAEGARVGAADLEETANALVGVMRTAPKDIHSAGEAMSTLTAIVGQGNMRLADLNAALGTGILPTAKLFGLGLRDVGAALDVMTSRGMPAELSATRLRTTLTMMVAPTSAAAGALKSIGLSGTQLADDLRKPNGLVVAIEDLKTHLVDSGLTATQQAQVIADAFGKSRGSAAIALLVQNVDDLKKHTNALSQQTGTSALDKAFQLTQQDTASNIERIKATLATIGVEFGKAIEPLLPILARFVGVIASIGHWFDSLSPSVRKVVTDIAAIALVLGPVLVAFGSLVSALALLVSPIGLVVIAIGAFGAAMVLLYTKVAWFRDAVNDAWQAIANASRAVWPTIQSIVTGAVNAIAGTFHVIQNVAQAVFPVVATIVGAAFTLIKIEIGVVVTAFQVGFDLIKGVVLTVFGLIKGYVDTIIIPAFNAIKFAITNILVPAFGFIKQPLIDLGNAFWSTFKWIASIVGDAMNFILGMFSTLLHGAGGFFDFLSGIPGIGHAFKGMGDAANAAGDKLDQLRKQFRDMGDQSNTTQSTVNAAAMSMGGTVSAQANKMADSINIVSGNFVKARTAAATNFQGLRDAVTSATQTASSNIYTALSNAATAVDTQSNKARTAGTGNYQGLRDAITSATQTASSNIYTALSNAATAVGTQSGKAKTAGTANYQGLNSAITNATATAASNVFTALSHAATAVGTQSNNAKTIGTSNYQTLGSQINKSVSTAASNVYTGMSNAATAVDTQSNKAARSSGVNFGHLVANIGSAMAGSVKAASSGADQIRQALNSELSSFGATTIKGVAISTGASVAGAASSIASGLFHAQGGLIQVGKPGDKGRDTIGLNVGGQPIVVGAGEQVAVFNRHQQAVVNQALGGMGGLPGLFSTVNKPHYMAGGGMVPGFANGGLWRSVIASAEDDVGKRGYRGNIISPYGYSELSMPPSSLNFSALGNLPYMTRMRIRSGSREVVAGKQDIGAGSSFLPVMGLYPGTVGQLGLSGGEFHVQIERADGAPLSAGGGSAMAVAKILAPKASGMGVVGTLVQTGLNKVADAATAYAQAHAPITATGNTAPSPMAGPGAVQAMIAMANSIAAHNYPYVLGGGHNSSFSGPYDCSGAVSAVLHAAGLLVSPMTSGEFDSWGASGAGKYVSLYSSPSHIFMSILGRYFGTSGSNPGGGANWISHFPESMPYVRHPYGLAKGGMVGLEQAFATMPGPLASSERKRHVNNLAAILPGLASGGLIPEFALGGILSFATGGTVKAKPKNKVVPAAKKPAKPPKLPVLKPLPGFDLNQINQITALDNQTQKLGAWQSYINQLHGGPAGAVALVTQADGSQTLNMAGMKDPSTGQWDKGITQRLQEIGAAGTRDINTELGVDDSILDIYNQQGTLAAKISTQFADWMGKVTGSIGIDSSEIGWLNHIIDPEWPLVGTENPAWPSDKFANMVIEKMWKPVWGPQQGLPWFQTETYAKWIADYAASYKNALASIAQWTKRKQEFAAEKQARMAQITERFISERGKLSGGKAADTVNASGILAEQRAALRKEETEAIAKVHSSPPGTWKGSKQAWTNETEREKTSIHAEFADRLRTLNEEAARQKLASNLKRSQALAGLSIQETAEKAALTGSYTAKANDLTNRITGAKTSSGGQKTYLTALRGSLQSQRTSSQAAITNATQTGGFRDTLNAYLDPMGTLAINRLTMQNITIPAVMAEIAALMSAKAIPAPAAGTDTGVGDTGVGAGDTGAGDTGVGGGDTGVGGGDTGVSAVATGPSAVETQTSAALQTLLTQAQQRLAVSEASFAVLRQSQGLIGPNAGMFRLGGFVGAYAGGGVLPQSGFALVGERGAELAHLPSGTRITPADQTARLMAPTTIHVIVQDGAVDPNKIQVIAKDAAQVAMRREARFGRRALPSGGGGWLK